MLREEWIKEEEEVNILHWSETFEKKFSVLLL